MTKAELGIWLVNTVTCFFFTFGVLSFGAWLYSFVRRR